MKKKKRSTSLKNSKSELLNLELYGAKDAWLAIRMNSTLLEEIKKQARKEKIPIQKFARRALISQLV